MAPVFALKASSSSLFKKSKEGKASNTAPQTPSPSQRNKNIPIWFSVFYGCPGFSSIPFDHMRFDASVPEDFSRPRRHHHIVDLPPSTPFSLNRRRRHAIQQRSAEELPIFRTIVKLAIRYSDEILARQKNGCAVCHMPAQSLVHRPICATRQGYLELADFAKLHRLMTAIASHTTGITSSAERDWAIGNFLSDRPFLCALAVPICKPKTECHRIVAKNVRAYIEAMLEDRLEPTMLQQDFETQLASYPDKQKSSPPPIQQPDDERYDEDACGDWLCSPESRIKLPQLAKDQLFKIRCTVFVGRPLLRIINPPPRGQLSCLVFSSRWPKDTLPGSFKNEADEAVDYCRVLGFHEEHVLQSADYRCAICSELVKARSLVHRPISFLRGTSTPQAGDIRQFAMKLFQFVEGRWTSPETNVALGSDNEAHIFDFAVPICESGAICEEVARTSAREFVKLLLPEGLKTMFPGLDPDTDLSRLQDELKWDAKNPKLLVKKIGSKGLMTEEADRGENPMDNSLTIAKLRRWYEICFIQELSKREYLKRLGYKRAGEDSDPESGNSETELDRVGTASRTHHTDSSLSVNETLISIDHSHGKDLETELENCMPLPPIPSPQAQSASESSAQRRESSQEMWEHPDERPLAANESVSDDEGYYDNDDNEYHDDHDLIDVNDNHDNNDATNADDTENKAGSHDLIGLVI